MHGLQFCLGCIDADFDHFAELRITPLGELGKVFVHELYPKCGDVSISTLHILGKLFVGKICNVMLMLDFLEDEGLPLEYEDDKGLAYVNLVSVHKK